MTYHLYYVLHIFQVLIGDNIRKILILI